MQAIPVRSPSVKWQVVEEEAVLVDTDSGSYFSLNAVGLFIWENADGQQTLGEILHGLVQEFDVDDETAWLDMQSFLDEMVNERLIVLDTSRIDPAS